MSRWDSTFTVCLSSALEILHPRRSTAAMSGAFLTDHSFWTWWSSARSNNPDGNVWCRNGDVLCAGTVSANCLCGTADDTSSWGARSTGLSKAQWTETASDPYRSRPPFAWSRSGSPGMSNHGPSGPTESLSAVGSPVHHHRTGWSNGGIIFD